MKLKELEKKFPKATCHSWSRAGLHMHINTEKMKIVISNERYCTICWRGDDSDEWQVTCKTTGLIKVLNQLARDEGPLVSIMVDMVKYIYSWFSLNQCFLGENCSDGHGNVIILIISSVINVATINTYEMYDDITQNSGAVYNNETQCHNQQNHYHKNQ